MKSGFNCQSFEHWSRVDVAVDGYGRLSSFTVQFRDVDPSHRVIHQIADSSRLHDDLDNVDITRV